MLAFTASSTKAQEVIASWNAKQCHDAVADATYIKENFGKAKFFSGWFEKVTVVAMFAYMIVWIIATVLTRNTFNPALMLVVGFAVLAFSVPTLNSDGGVRYALTPKKWQNWVSDYSHKVSKVELTESICKEIAERYESLEDINPAIQQLVLEIVMIENAFDKKQMPRSVMSKLQGFQEMLHEHTSTLRWTKLGHGDLSEYFRLAGQEWLKLAAQSEVITDFQI